MSSGRFPKFTHMVFVFECKFGNELLEGGVFWNFVGFALNVFKSEI